MLELRRFLDEIQKRLLLGQGQSVAFGRFVLVGGFNGRQDTILAASQMLQSWVSVALVAGVIVAAFIGAAIGKGIVKKHLAA